MKAFLVRANDNEKDFPFTHPWNPSTQITMRSLGDAVGLKRTGVHLVRVAAGKESFPMHSHHCEEEWLYVIAGQAVVEIGDERFEIGAGDFVGLPVASPPHHLSNPFNEELVYLTGGERSGTDVADFPKLGKRMVRVGMKVAVHTLENAAESPIARFGFEKR